jgi:hypothetical protein
MQTMMIVMIGDDCTFQPAAYIDFLRPQVGLLLEQLYTIQHATQLSSSKLRSVIEHA